MSTTIRRADLVGSVADALQFISYYHPADYIRALGRAYEREQSGAAKDAIAQILTNSRMFESMGVSTGVNLDKLMLARKMMVEVLPAEQTYGHFALAGLPKGFRAAA